MAVGTAHAWVHDVSFTEDSFARWGKRLSDLHRTPHIAAHHALARNATIRRQTAYDNGYRSNPTAQDGMCIGLYWGEGSKSEGAWQFVNSDKESISEMIQWAIRAGQSPNAFCAGIQVHPEDNLRPDEVSSYWSTCGIPEHNIRVRFLRSPTSKKVSKRRIMFGTCAVMPIKNGVYLFEYCRGQRDLIRGISTGSASLRLEGVAKW